MKVLVPMKRTNAVYFSLFVFGIFIHSYRFLEIISKPFAFHMYIHMGQEYYNISSSYSRNTLMPSALASSNISIVHIEGNHTTQELQLTFIPLCYPCPFNPNVLLTFLLFFFSICEGSSIHLLSHHFSLGHWIQYNSLRYLHVFPFLSHLAPLIVTYAFFYLLKDKHGVLNTGGIQ